MQSLADFRQPEPNRAITSLLELLLPVYLKYADHLTIHFSGDFHNRLSEISSRPCVILLNHADRQDPLVVLALARMLGQPIYSLIARETFNWNHGVRGWFFQKLGCFSINKGAPNRDAIITFKRLLSTGSNKLIVFPESEVTADEHKIHALDRTLFHLLLEAQHERMSARSADSIVLLPIATSYELRTDLEQSLSGSLARVEQRLNLTRNSKHGIMSRVETAKNAILKQLAEHYRYAQPERCIDAHQLRLLIRHICEKIVQYRDYDLQIDKCSDEEILHQVRHNLTREIDGTNGCTPYQSSLILETRRQCRHLISDLDRVERMLIFARVLDQPLSAVQTCRVVDFLECETTGRMTGKGRQLATVGVQRPIDLISFDDAYTADKSRAISSLANAVQRSMQEALETGSARNGTHHSAR